MNHAQENFVAFILRHMTGVGFFIFCGLLLGFIWAQPRILTIAQKYSQEQIEQKFEVQDYTTESSVQAALNERSNMSPDERDALNKDQEIVSTESDIAQNPGVPDIVLPEVPDTSGLPHATPDTGSGELAYVGEFNPKAMHTAGYFVQVGAFQNRIDADALEQRLNVSGWNTQLEYKQQDGTYLLWVGPENDRTAAESNVKKLEHGMGLKGFIVQLHH